MKKKLLKLILIPALFAVAGCASIVSKSVYPVNIQSNPSQVEFTVANKAGSVVARGKTPQTVMLKAGAGYFQGERYRITFTKNGLKTKSIELDTSLDGWYFGNILFGGPLGILVIDPLTGAMFKLPESVMVDLELDKNALNIMSMDDLTEAQKAQLIPLKPLKK